LEMNELANDAQRVLEYNFPESKKKDKNKDI